MKIDSDGTIILNEPTRILSSLSIAGATINDSSIVESTLSVGTSMRVEGAVELTDGINLNADGEEVNNPHFTVANGEFKKVSDNSAIEAQYVSVAVDSNGNKFICKSDVGYDDDGLNHIYKVDPAEISLYFTQVLTGGKYR